MRRTFLNVIRLSFVAAAFLISNNLDAQVKILFDATKGEMAGNADWVIDYDSTNLGVGSSGVYRTSSGNQSNPQRIPTPAQSGITSSTAETYWSGALSSWAVDCAKKGYIVETLPYSGQITYGNTSNAQDLSNYTIFVVDEPNIKFASAEKTVIMQFVQNGGRLFIISDHNNSDRNGDGWDSPNIWNDFLTTNSVQTYPFGFTFDLADFSQTTTNISASSTDSIIHGPMGNVTKAQWSGGTTMTLDPTKNSTVKGVIFTTGTTPGNTNVMVAYARYGTHGGKVAAMGDSSPADDGTGNPVCTLYNGYWSDASGNHRLLIMNMTIWLATADSTPISHVGVEEVSHNEPAIVVAPNPSRGMVSISTNNDLDNVSITIMGITGNVIAQKSITGLKKEQETTFNLEPGFYLVKFESEKGMQTSRVVVY